MKITFVRHGQSTANIGEPCDDHTLIALTPLGHQQAEKISTTWTRRPDRIYLSPFLRTHLTAAPTIARFPKVPVETLPMEEFTYLDPSLWKGSTWESRRPEVIAYWEAMDPDHVHGPGAESFSTLLSRVRLVLDHLEDQKPEWALAFTHGQFMQAVKVVVENPSEAPKELMVRLYHERIPDNTETLSIELREGRWSPLQTPPNATSALFCDHANEMPATCPCQPDCYCKANACRNS